MIDVKTKFVTVIVLRVDPADFSAMARQAQLVAERKVPLLKGFIQSVIMGSEDKSRLLFVSLWESRAAWSAAQWDEELGRTLTAEVEGAQAFEIHNYEPVSIVHASP